MDEANVGKATVLGEAKERVFTLSPLVQGHFLHCGVAMSGL
jgi:hypothetical protein